MRMSALPALLILGLSTAAAEPIAAPKPEPIAAPRPEPIAAPPPVPPAYFVGPPIIRIDRYAVWQNYAVDRQGYFRPRVIDSPYGAYYFVNGRPYPWATVHPLNFMPYASD